MITRDHYAAPTASTEVTTQYGPFAIAVPTDHADVFILTLPKPMVRVAILSLIASAFLLLGIVLQLLMYTDGNLRNMIIAWLVVLSVAHIASAKLIRDGRILVAIGSLGLSALTLITMLVLAFVGAITLFQIAVLALAVCNFIFVALTLRDIATIGAANARLCDLRRADLSNAG